VQEGLESEDYRVLLGHARHDATVEARQVELFLEHRVDGIIAVTDEFTIEHLEDWLQELLMQNTPCVLVDDSSFCGRADCVVSDDFHGVRQVVEHLSSLGHRRIAHLAGGGRVSSGRDRLAAFQSAAEDAGIASEVVVVPSSGYVLTPWNSRVRELMGRSPAPTALFCANDTVAAEALDALDEMGIRVPGDVSVVGYAGFEVGRALKLTSVNQHPQEMGRVAARRLLDRIGNRDLPPQLFTLPVELEPRRTSAQAPN
jgi:LacI family transcriptional regulator